jgi:ABC-type transport system involved in cytochrome c biogenesis permease subunit
VESYQLGIGHAPFSNLYESLIFFSWTITLLYLIVEWRTKNRTLGAFVMPLAFLAMAYASFSPNIASRIQPLIPALKSNWLITHVITCFFAYAAFGISFGLSLMYFIKRLDNDKKNSTLLTLGIITGSVWAYSAWGRYWGWDPKETWSLITWFIYAAVLHSRMVRGWTGKKIAIMSIIGFVCVLITYFGVNYLAGLHSYATS